MCADITTQSFEWGEVSILSGNDASSLYMINNNPLAMPYNICDDCVSRPISFEFEFRYFEQSFTQAWMYSNGVLSFLEPTWQSFCCGGEILNNMMGGDYNYKIFPLWTDLIGGAGTFYSLTTAESAIFGWYNIHEYGTNNLSSFEIELKSDSTFKIIYGDVNVGWHTITMGFTGNASNNEYYQFFNGLGINQPADNTTIFTRMQVNPCDNDPLFSSSCPGYDEAFLLFQCSINPLYSSTCIGYEEAYAQQLALERVEQTTEQPAPVVETANVTTASDTTASTGVTSDSTSTFTDVRTDAGGASISSTGAVVIETGVPDIVRDNGEDKKTQKTSVDVQSIARAAVQETEKTAMSVVNESVQQSMVDDNTGNSDDMIALYASMSNDNMAALTGYVGYNNPAGLPAMFIQYNDEGQQQSAIYVPDVVTQDDIRDDSDKSKASEREIGETFTSDNKRELLEALLDNGKQTQNENNKEEIKEENVNQTVKDNDAASDGPKIEMIATTNPGFDLYQSTFIKDANFYQPKDIYKNQANVDNQRAVRSLNFKNDILHQQLIQQQYNRK